MEQMTLDEAFEPETYSQKEADAFELIMSPLKDAMLADGLSPDALIFAHKSLEKSSYSSIYFGYENNLFCRVRFRGRKNYLEMPIRYEAEASKYGIIEKPKRKKADAPPPQYFKLICKDLDTLVAYTPLFKSMLNRVIELYPTEFGCCSRYVECSNAKHCINPDKNLALQCYYLKNLRKGIIFYGENKVDGPVFF